MDEKIKLVISTLLYAFGLGVLFHDYLHDMWVIGGHAEIIGLQGGYFGAIIMTIGYIMALFMTGQPQSLDRYLKKIIGKE